MRSTSFGIGLLFVGLAAWAVLGKDTSPEKARAKICAYGYAQSLRPSKEESHRLKLRLLHDAGIPEKESYNYILDHRTPLCLGGDPTSLTNLQLQRPEQAQQKDELEVWACKSYCAGTMTLEEARGLFRRDPN